MRHGLDDHPEVGERVQRHGLGLVDRDQQTRSALRGSFANPPQSALQRDHQIALVARRRDQLSGHLDHPGVELNAELALEPSQRTRRPRLPQRIRQLLEQLADGIAFPPGLVGQYRPAFPRHPLPEHRQEGGLADTAVASQRVREPHVPRPAAQTHDMLVEQVGSACENGRHHPKLGVYGDSRSAATTLPYKPYKCVPVLAPTRTNSRISGRYRHSYKPYKPIARDGGYGSA